jgi:prepilin-type N-terminal cleavage/methylation domain-containing protein
MSVQSDQRGVTLIELSLALVVGLLVVLALGRIVLANQRSWEQGRDKTELQQNTTEALEWMARSVRSARTVAVIDTTEFRTYDAAGSLVHTYELVAGVGQPRLHEDGSELTDRPCTLFYVLPDADTTGVTLTIELEDRAGNRVAAQTRATLRNQSFQF